MKKEKTIHELAKEFPEKTYRELELYQVGQPTTRKRGEDNGFYS